MGSYSNYEAFYSIKILCKRRIYFSANPDDLTSNKGCLSKELSKWKTIQSLTPLNLMYDVTPPDLVSAVVTELAVLPCTSVPVILRIKPPDLAF